MKTILITLVHLFLFGTTTFAQSEKYQKAMAKNVAQFDTARSLPTVLALMNAFERVAAVEKTQWLPYYYANVRHDRSQPRAGQKSD